MVTFGRNQGDEGRILVDGRDMTGKSRTFAFNSTHSIRADAREGSFKGWATSGGVKVEDPRAYDTAMEIEGDGSLMLQLTSTN